MSCRFFHWLNQNRDVFAADQASLGYMCLTVSFQCGEDEESQKEENKKTTYTSGCACGAIRYAIAAEPLTATDRVIVSAATAKRRLEVDRHQSWFIRTEVYRLLR